MKRILLITLSIFLFNGFPYAKKDSCSEYIELQKDTYGFKPSELSKEDLKAKEEELDKFWKAFESAGENQLECLKKMLKDNLEDAYFCLDGSALLYTLEDSPEAHQLIARTLEYADLEEIDIIRYIYLVIRLSHSGIDVEKLAARYMKHPDVSSFLSQHALPIDRAFGGLFLYGSMPREDADSNLISLLYASEDYAIETAMVLLAYSMTERSFKVLDSLAKSNAIPDSINFLIYAIRLKAAMDVIDNDSSGKPLSEYDREQVLSYLSGARDDEKGYFGFACDMGLIQSAVLNLQEKDLHYIYEARRKSTYNMSDESYYEYEALTAVLFGLINRLGLYKEYRKY